MAFTYEDWKERIQNRSDISGILTHLTKPQINTSGLSEDEINFRAIDNLIKILMEQKITGSITEKGFIVGDTPAVCFQDTPLYGLVQNIEFERQKRLKNLREKIRYCGIGIVFGKPYVFTKGGRPVIYEQTEIAKQFLPRSEYWRIVNYRINYTDTNFIDWTHEREWRKPGDFEFDIQNCHVVVHTSKCFHYFNQNCPSEILEKLFCGTSVLKSIIM